MPPKNTPSIYPYLAASFIEASEKWNTIEAIRFITQEELKWLKGAHKKTAELRKIMEESKKREAHIFSQLKNLDEEWGNITYTLNQGTKMMMRPILSDFLFLYEHRMGKEGAERLWKLFSSENDESYDFILEYAMDENTKKFYIKRLTLIYKPTETQDDSEEEELEYPLGTIFQA